MPRALCPFFHSLKHLLNTSLARFGGDGPGSAGFLSAPSLMHTHINPFSLSHTHTHTYTHTHTQAKDPVSAAQDVRGRRPGLV